MQNLLSQKDGETKTIEAHDLTLDNIETALANDNKVKLAGVDVDGEFGRKAHPLNDLI